MKEILMRGRDSYSNWQIAVGISACGYYFDLDLGVIWLIASCSYFPAPAAIFLTIVSTSFLSLSFKFME